jgi:hypothetical protein
MVGYNVAYLLKQQGFKKHTISFACATEGSIFDAMEATLVPDMNRKLK